MNKNLGKNLGQKSCRPKNVLPQKVAQQFHPHKNFPLTVESLTSGSKKVIWWLGDCGHEWEAQVYKRATRNDDCPYCSGHRTLQGYNDLGTQNPELANEWHPHLNEPLKPTQITKNSNKKVWWLGNCGHEWEAIINNRNKGATCPYCSHKKVSFQESLAEQNPTIAAEWHPTKNGNMKPEHVFPNSHKLVWWKDAYEHEWEATISKRNNGTGCPVCAGRKVLKNFSDLATTHPFLIKEWHPTKNGDLTFHDVSKGSEKKVWWICSKKHEWETPVYGRMNDRNCPTCAHNIGTSKAEKSLLQVLEYSKILIKQSDRTVLGNGQEIDLFFPEKNIGIEFNGLYWHDENHKNKNYHYNKYVTAKNKGIQLIQIWEDDWKRNPQQVERMVLHKLGVSHCPKVFARKTEIHTVTKTVTENFLNNNHIQGNVNGSIRLGLFSTNNKVKELVAVIVFKAENNNGIKTLNLLRYATSVQVVGGFSKLLSYVENSYSGVERIVTFSDNCVSDGNLYVKNGFVADKELPPDYMYVVDKVRKHKFGYRLKRFKNDENLFYDPLLSERELAVANNIPRIWDAGKIRWVKTVK